MLVAIVGGLIGGILPLVGVIVANYIIPRIQQAQMDRQLLNGLRNELAFNLSVFNVARPLEVSFPIEESLLLEAIGVKAVASNADLYLDLTLLKGIYARLTRLWDLTRRNPNDSSKFEALRPFLIQMHQAAVWHAIQDIDKALKVRHQEPRIWGMEGTVSERTRVAALNAVDELSVSPEEKQELKREIESMFKVRP